MMTTTASDWGDFDEELDAARAALYQIARALKATPNDGVRVSLGVSNDGNPKIVEMLRALGGTRQAHASSAYYRGPGMHIVIVSSTLWIEDVEFHAQYSYELSAEASARLTWEDDAAEKRKRAEVNL